MSEPEAILVCRRLLPAGTDPLGKAGYELREGGLEATRERLPELALALTTAAARRVGEAAADLRSGRWDGWDPAAYLGLELSGATFGIVGLGRIGTRYAELVRPLAGELLYVARSPKPESERSLGAVGVELDELLERADVVSLHAPASSDTHHLIGPRELDAMG